MIDLTYTDSDGIEQGIIKAYQLDLAYGSDENDFELTLPIDMRIAEKSLIYIDGTEWGGIVRGGRESTMGETPVFVARGETWHGMLAETYICPETDHLSASGEANAAIGSVLRFVGLSDVFDASAEPSGISVSHQFERFTDCYSGFRKMLAASGAKLRIDKQPGRKPALSAVPIGDYVDSGESNKYGYKLEWYMPFNHLICLGMGELEERTVLHLYADAEGNVSQTQTLFGLDERQAVYEYNNIDEAKLLEDGTKKLKEMQGTSACELLLPEGTAFDVGDMVGIASEKTGRSVISTVSKAIVKVSGNGQVEITNEIGEISVRKYSSSGNSTFAGGIVYKAGKGIDISGATIEAEVTKTDLDGKANKSHSHNWESITGKPTSYPPASHSHDWESVKDKPASFPPEAHAHGWAEVQGKPEAFPPLDHSHPWNGITGKPEAFEPKDHAHAVATKDADGFMSAADKSIIESLSGGSVTGVKGESESEYRTGNVSLTPANIGAPGANTANGWCKLTYPNGAETGWLQTTQNGILPYSANSSGIGSWDYQFGEVRAVNVYRSNAACISGTVLYANGTGSNGTVILSQDAESCQCIRIIYRDNDWFYASRDVIWPSGKYVTLDITSKSASEGMFWHKTRTVLIAGNSVGTNGSRYGCVSISGPGNSVGSSDNQANNIYITAVIGYTV